MSQHQYQTPGRGQPRRTSLLGPVLGSIGAVAALVLLFLFGTLAGNSAGSDPAAATTEQAAGASKAKAKTKPQPEPQAEPQRPGIGQAARDGKFEFVVSEVDCSKTRVGLPHLERTAAGKFCLVSLSVKNIAGRPQFFLSSAQKVFDAVGAKFNDDEIAGFYANRDTQTFLRKIDPGKKVVGKIVFDVPKATKLATIELHDSFFSGGVQVALK